MSDSRLLKATNPRPHGPSLTIAYATLAERAHSISAPSLQRQDIELLVCVQGRPLSRQPNLPHARLLSVNGYGVARSRNVAIDQATADYLLFSDDDVTVNLAGVLAGIEHLQKTGHALVLGRGVDPTGVSRKNYPPEVTALSRFNSAKAATYEMLIDVAQIRASGVRFDERFGAGAELHLGDEYIFIADLLASGLTGAAIPHVFGTHPTVSSGSTWGTQRDGHARAVAINRVFGRWAPAARLAFALKNHAKLGGLRPLLTFVADGATPPPHELSRAVALHREAA